LEEIEAIIEPTRSQMPKSSGLPKLKKTNRTRLGVYKNGGEDEK